MAAKTSLKVRLGFGSGELSSSIFFTITSFWLMNFLTDEVRLSATLAGTALLVGKIWDALIDPFIGHFSDHTRSRWGRRKPYLLFFAIPFGLAFVLMFRNPGIEGQTGKFIWALLTYVFFCTVYSFTNIPYNSLLPEMTDDYHERTNISGFKQAFAVVRHAPGRRGGAAADGDICQSHRWLYRNVRGIWFSCFGLLTGDFFRRPRTARRGAALR